jgi:hypothetical protein
MADYECDSLAARLRPRQLLLLNVMKQNWRKFLLISCQVDALTGGKIDTGSRELR